MKKILFSTAVLLLSFFYFGCNNQGSDKQTEKNMNDSSTTTFPSAAAFQQTIDGKPVSLYTIKNTKGMKAAITNFGGRLVSLFVADKNGKPVDVIVGFDNLNDFVKISTDPYYGATIGRYGNRIAKAKLCIDGVEYKLAANNGANSLYGVQKGFHNVVCDSKPMR